MYAGDMAGSSRIGIMFSSVLPSFGDRESLSGPEQRLLQVFQSQGLLLAYLDIRINDRNDHSVRERRGLG